MLVGMGAAGGYAVSRDSIRNTFELAASHLYRISRETIGELGFVSLEDEPHGLIKASVQDTHVTVTIKPVSERAVELTVKARRFLLPKIDIAQTVYNRIIQRL